MRKFTDPSGRYIVCDITNIYGPNEDDSTFFKQVFDRLHDFACEEIILGGDFNLVLDDKEDKKGGLPRTHQNALKIIKQNCEELNLTDIWRMLNADKHRYTRRRKKPEIQCRLDFFLISSDLICDINLADILHECESFFKDLYSSKMRTDSSLPETDFFFSENDIILSPPLP